MSYLSVDELKDYLKMSKSCIYKWCTNKQIPYIKRGKILLFKKDEIDRWLESRSVPTKDEVGNNVSKLLKAKQ